MKGKLVTDENNFIRNEYRIFGKGMTKDELIEQFREIYGMKFSEINKLFRLGEYKYYYYRTSNDHKLYVKRTTKMGRELIESIDLIIDSDPPCWKLDYIKHEGKWYPANSNDWRW